MSGYDSKRVHVLTRLDAARLYHEFHRQPTAVLHTTKVEVRTAPDLGRNERWWISLAKFCRYKAFLGNTRSGTFRTWSSEFAEWATAIGCANHADPRCLPFHVYKTKLADALDSDSGRRRFAQHHHCTDPHGLRDDGGFLWVAADDRHGGREEATVAGCVLPQGHHWDMKGPLDSTVRLLDEVYLLGRHLNVFPDGHALAGTSRKGKWTRERSRQEDRRELERSRA